MRKVTYYIKLVLLLVSSAGFAQTETKPGPIIGFADSIRIALEFTRNVDAEVIGGGFTTAWLNLGLDQQEKIKRQTYLMRSKGYKLRAHLHNYFGSIAFAMNREGIDVRQMNQFLQMCDKVIQNYSPHKAATIFKLSRDFFEHHSLYYDNTYRLHAVEDDYEFVYIENLPPPIDTTYSDTEWNDQPVSDTAWDDQPVDNTSWDDGQSNGGDYVAKPYWEELPPPPLIEGAAIQFSKVNLNIVTSYDSVFLRNTKGVYSLENYMFVGENGVFDWSPAGLPPDSVYCNFTTYSFVARKPEIQADLVKLNYVGKTPGFIPGKFEFKSQNRRDTVPSTYPRFTSYQSNLKIKNLGPDSMEYIGGFSVHGYKILSTNVTNDPATIILHSSASDKFRAQSTAFEFLDSAILADQAEFTIYQRNDSIRHRKLRMKYDFGRNNLLLRSDNGKMRNTPYSASYFSMDFSANEIRWDLAADSLDIATTGGRNTVPMIFESINYYDPEDYRLLGGVGFRFHPLAMLANYCVRNGTRETHTGELADFYKFDIREIQAAMEFLAIKGMIDYYPRQDLIIVKDKAMDLYMAKLGKADYDNMKIHSVIGTYSNASLSMERGEMVVRGVEEFKVSDSLNVLIKPDSSIITLLQNRDVKFNGTITAGNFEITGKDFTLKYDSFYINMLHIDSINFYTMETNAKGQTVRRKINNSMVSADSTAAAEAGMGNTAKSSGTLYINLPTNKSGLKEIPNYPRLDAEAGGVIYFDRPEVLGGVYDKSVYFVVPPFKLDSLNDADPTALNFDGTFVSSGMFPSFKETLHTMADKSLGFDHQIPPGGYQLYKGDGRLNGGHLRLDNRGLRSDGTINFLAAHVYSYEFVYYPDSVTARGHRVKIEDKQFGAVKFPQASFGDYIMKWYPKQDKMHLKNVGAPFNFYDSTAQLTGIATISKNGVAGAGKLETRGTELRSREMTFTSTDFGARHARFKAKSADPSKPLLDGTDVRVKFNLTENYANISPEIEGVAALDFPYAQFKTSIPNARWDLTEHKISMSKTPDAPIESSYFYTTRKDLDSLSFYAESAEYDLNKQELKVNGIPYIVVADAKITPDRGEVLILENAKIGTLKNTTIILDTLDGYHRLTEGVVDIVSRKEFSGYATYQYVNLLSDTFAIKMTDFHLEPIGEIESRRSRSNRRKSLATMQTVATGSLSDENKIVLGAGMFYKGDLVMYATRPALQLAGSIKLDIKNIKNYDTWIRYSQTGEETEVLIDFDNAITEDGRKVDAGLHFTAAENDLYISFLNEKNDEDDDFFLPSGTLFYDTATNDYKIEDREKAAGNKLSGKVFAYNDESTSVRFEGPIKLMPGTRDWEVTATAIGQGNMQTNEIRMNTLVMVQTGVASQAFDVMARDLQMIIQNEGAEEGLGDQTELLYKIADIVGERTVRDYEEKSTQSYVSLAAMPATAKQLTFANVDMKWSKDHHAFYSEGSLGLSNIGKNDINGGFEGFMEIKKNEDGGAIMNIFLKASPDSWYYFGYEDNRLLMQSSNAEFNSVVAKRTNSGKAKIGELVFVPGSDEETLAFINRFRRDYYGIEVPYDLHAGSTSKKKTEDKKENDGF